MSLDERGIEHNTEPENSRPANEITLYTTEWCSSCWTTKQVLDTLRVPYREINIGNDEDAAERVMQINNGYRSVPTLVFPDGSVLTEPRAPVLVEKLQAYL